MKTIIVTFFYRYGRDRRNAALAHLTANINARDVRGGHFELPIDPKGHLGGPWPQQVPSLHHPSSLRGLQRQTLQSHLG